MMGFLLRLLSAFYAFFSFVAISCFLILGFHSLNEQNIRSNALEVTSHQMQQFVLNFNLRLNSIREQMLHLYEEQNNLSRALSENERERLVFFRRDFLSAFAVVVQSAGGQSEVQKYFSKEKLTDDEKKNLTAQFVEFSQSHQQSFWIKRAQNLPATILNANTGPGAELYWLGYAINDIKNEKPFLLLGLFRSSYLFKFCRADSESVDSSSSDLSGIAKAQTFLLDEQGRVLCHSLPKYEGSSFHEYSFYSKLQQAGVQTYENMLGTPTLATVKSIRLQSNDPKFSQELLMVAEKPFVKGSSIFYLPVSLSLGLKTHSISLLTFLLVLAMFGFVLGLIVFFRGSIREKSSDQPSNNEPRASVDPSDAAFPIDSPIASSIASSIDASVELPVDLSEKTFASIRVDTEGAAVLTKLKHELKELETTLLDLQSTQAFLAHLQRELTARWASYPDLYRFLLDSLSVWDCAVFWFEREVHPETKMISYRLLEAVNIDGPRVGELIWSAEQDVLLSDGAEREFLKQKVLGLKSYLRNRSEPKLAPSEFILQEVVVRDRKFGLLVLERPDPNKISVLSSLDLLPQIAQIFSMVAAVALEDRFGGA